MNNKNVMYLLDECDTEINKIDDFISRVGFRETTVKYVTKYSIIKVCGTIEQCFKIIISDTSCANQNEQVTKFINDTFRSNSINPSYENICKSLKRFDEEWNKRFKELIDSNVSAERLKSSLRSLNSSRNDFAHGGNPTTTFNDIKSYYDDVKQIITYLDQIVC